MEILSIILCLWLFALVIALFIWMFVMQNSVTKLSDSVHELKKLLLRDSLQAKQPVTDEFQKSEIPTKTIDEIPDDILLSKKRLSENENAEIKSNKQPTSQSKIIESYIKQDSPTEFEKVFLGNIFNKIGAFAILIGIIIFIKLISPFIIFTPAIKAALGFLSGFVMIAAALKLHGNKKLQNYSEVLLGTGFGTLFITTYCGSTILDIFDMKLTFTIATGLLLVAFYLADKLKTISMLVISLIAGYLNPFFIQPQAATAPNFLMGYLIFVNLLSIIYTFKNNSRNTVNIVNLCLTLITSVIFAKAMPLYMPAILWILYFSYGLTCNGSQLESNKKLNLVNYFTFSILLYHIDPFNIKTVAFVQLALTGIYAGAAYIKNKNPEVFKTYLHIMLAAFTIFIMSFCDKTPSAKCIAWSIEAAVLSFFAYKFKYKALANWASGIWTAALLSIIPIDGVFATKSIGKFSPIWNIRLYMFAPVILSSGISHFFLSKSQDKKFLTISEFFRFDCIALIYLYMGLELNNIINKWFIGEDTSSRFINHMINSILGFAYTINLKKLHKATGFACFNIFSALAGILTTIYLLFTGVHYKPAEAFFPVINLRTAAFLSGVAAAIFWARWTKDEVYKYLAVFLGFILIHFEINDIITKYVLVNAQYLTSICWILYSGTITAIGIYKNKEFLKLSGIGLCILSILRIFIYDNANVDILYKFIAFLTLGAILMILSYIYNKRLK